MKIGRKALALALTAGALPASLLNLGGTAGAATWTFYKLPNASGGSEPGIDIGLDADGKEVIYVHGTYGIPNHNRAWIRQPGLAEYQPPELNEKQGFKQITFSNPYSRLPGGGDADIAFRGNDMWFIDLWAGSNSIQYSPDKGATWTLGTPFTTLPLSDRQWIALGETVPHPVTGLPQTTVYVAYQTFQGVPFKTAIARSRDNGLTWDFHRAISGVSGIPAHIVSDGGKTVAVAVGSGGNFRVAVSRDEGATWTTKSVSGGVSDAQGWAVGLSMNPLNPNEMAITYPTSGSAPGGVSAKTAVRVSHDGGNTWGELVRMEPNAPLLGPVDWFPWVDYRGDKVAVSWYQSTDMMSNRDPNNGGTNNKWHVWYSESLDDGATFSTPQQVTTFSAKNGAICTKGLSCGTTGGVDRELGDFMQIAIDTSGDATGTAGKSYIAMVHAAPGPLGGGVYVYKQN